MVGGHHWLNGPEFEQAPGDSEGQGSLACCSSQSHRELDTNERLNNSKALGGCETQGCWETRRPLWPTGLHSDVFSTEGSPCCVWQWRPEGVLQAVGGAHPHAHPGWRLSGPEAGVLPSHPLCHLSSEALRRQTCRFTWCWGVGPQGVLKENVSRYLLQMRIKLVCHPFYHIASQE